MKHWHEIGIEKSSIQLSSSDFAILEKTHKIIFRTAKWHEEKNVGPVVFVILQQDMDGIKKASFFLICSKGIFKFYFIMPSITIRHSFI